ARIVVERVHSTVLEIEDEESVAIARRCVDRVREQITALVERDVAHAAEQLIVASDEIVEDDVGAARTLRLRIHRRARSAGRRATRGTAASTRRVSSIR